MKPRCKKCGKFVSNDPKKRVNCADDNHNSYYYCNNHNPDQKRRLLNSLNDFIFNTAAALAMMLESASEAIYDFFHPFE